MNIEASKQELIKLIADVQSERLVEQLKQMVKMWENKAATEKPAVSRQKKSKALNKVTKEQEELWRLAAQPMPTHISLEELAKEQNYSGEKLRKAFQEWDYSLFEDQSLEELLNSLTP